MNWIIILLAAVGLTLIVTISDLFKPWRELMSKTSDRIGKLFSCPMCFGFWAGLICAGLWWLGLWWLLIGFASSGIAFFIYSVIVWMERN